MVKCRGQVLLHEGSMNSSVSTNLCVLACGRPESAFAVPLGYGTPEHPGRGVYLPPLSPW